MSKLRLQKLFNEQNEVATFMEILNLVCMGELEVADGTYLLANSCLLEVEEGELELIDLKIVI